MFESKHYVPILKWKRAEQKALATLKDEDKKNITPLIQLVMPKPKFSKGQTEEKTQEQLLNEVVSNFKEKLPKIPDEILKSWGKSYVFLDLSLLYTTSLKVESFEQLITRGNKLGAFFVPVLNLSDDHAVKKVVCSLSKKRYGLCLRLVRADLTDLTKLPEKIEDFLTSNDLTEKDIDLLIDIKIIERNNDEYLRYTNLGQKIPNILKWRTFTFASGAFPKDLTKYKIDEETLIPRLDWQNWKSQNKKLQRNPFFADYSIQHPIYDESSQFFAPTTSIKYTLENDWLILKGEKQNFGLYLANAKLLSEDDRFFGEDFSDGDKYVAEKAKHYEEYIKNPEIKGTGSTETWLRAGINHHLVCTANQIANLP